MKNNCCEINYKCVIIQKPDSHIIDRVIVVLDLSNSATRSN